MARRLSYGGATPAEIVRKWDARKAREASAARAKATVANDNEPRPADGVIMFNGEPMKFWLPEVATVAERERATA